MKGYELCNIVIGPKMTFGIYRKISPNPCLPDRQASLPKRGTGLLPLWKRGMEGDFSKIIFMLLCEPMAHVDSRERRNPENDGGKIER